MSTECQCDATALIKVSADEENQMAGYCRFALNLIWLKWMDWLAVRLISVSNSWEVLFFVCTCRCPLLPDFISTLKMQCTSLFVLVCLICFQWKVSHANWKEAAEKKNHRSEKDPPMVPTKDLYLFCTCIVFRDVFNYFGCWNKACLCGQLDMLSSCHGLNAFL